MTHESPTVRVHVNIELSASSIQAVVANVKKKTSPDNQGRYRVDTADALGDLISAFLREKNFDEYADNEKNY